MLGRFCFGDAKSLFRQAVFRIPAGAGSEGLLRRVVARRVVARRVVTVSTGHDGSSPSTDPLGNSRASLDAESLARFYTQVGEHLAPGGWVANPDHVGLPDTWNRRLRTARRALIPPVEKGSGHAHPNPLPTVRLLKTPSVQVKQISVRFRSSRRQVCTLRSMIVLDLSMRTSAITTSTYAAAERSRCFAEVGRWRL
jgi:hypothetical protein